MDETEEVPITINNDNIDIPNENIYKTHILDENGDVSHVFVFCAGLRSSEHLSDMFSEIELKYYQEKDVNIVFSNELILKDDTIRSIKYKIVKELLDFSKKNKSTLIDLSIEELYLFSSSEKYLDMVQLYQEITKNDTLKLSKERFFQYATNISADPYVLNDGSKDHGGLYNDVFSYDQWINLCDSGKKEIFIPVGMEFQSDYDFMFTSNPYKNQLWTEPIRYEINKKNPLLTFEKSLLLNYGHSKNIMVCLAKNSLQYAESMNINTEYFCELYYPFLYKLGYTSLNLLQEASGKLSQETATYNNSKKNEKNKFITRTYREIYWSRENNMDMPFLENGIRNFNITISSKNNVQYPLELIFRKIHSNEEIPYVKYNPGIRKENMYRLYAKNVSYDGKKIPFLSESLILRLSRDSGKTKQITLLIQNKLTILVHIQSNGNIIIEGKLDKTMQMETINEYLIITLKSLFEQLNTILKPLGYSIQEFKSIYDENISSTLFDYQYVLSIDSKINLSQQLEYITPIFNVFSTDLSQGAKMRFKRVRNFKEMDAKATLIRETYEKSGNSEDVIDALMTNFDMEEEEAILAFAEFRSQFQLLKQKIIENPGFETNFQMKSLKNELTIDIKNISSPDYIPELFIYIDTILRLSQKSKSVRIPSGILKKFKTKQRSDKKVVEQDEVDTVIATKKDLTDLYKPEKEDVDEDEVNQEIEQGGIEFDDYEYYQDYEEDETEDVEDEGDTDSSEEMMGGENNSEDEEDEDDDGKTNIDYMPIKNPSPFFKKMRELDPTLFVTEESSKFPLYSKACPSGDKRQPIILTDEEKKKIDETNPGSYDHALYYGSSEEKKHWYICPRYWCLKTNSSITEKDVKAGKCGNIIPRNASKVPPGAYVYEFNNPKNHTKDGKYVQHVPGFLKKKVHPDGLCVPCCFAKAWDSKDQVLRRQECDYEKGFTDVKKEKRNTRQPVNTKTQSYIISSVNYPLPENRWGYLPIAMQLFFKSDANRVIDPKNTAFLKNGEKSLLRYGIEKSENQSFLACLAYFYAWKQRLETVPSIEEMREILVDAMDLDMFIQYHNGNLVSIFKPKDLSRFTIQKEMYSNSDFYKTINLSDDIQVEYLEETIASYHNFQKFIKDKNSMIDHTYLWDFFCNRNNALMKDGINLVILQIKDTDITESVQFICPSNAYSSVEYDERKETAIIIKQEKFYEPIHLYSQFEKIVKSKTNEIVYNFEKGDHLVGDKVLNVNNNVVYKLKVGETNFTETTIKKTFIDSITIPEIKDVLNLIKYTKKKYCGALPSMPKIYKFQHGMKVNELIRLLKLHHYQVTGQVLNYKNKTIGVQVKKESEQSPLFVPCYPSYMLKDLPSTYMDNMEIWLDYRETRNRLLVIHEDTNGKVLCKPKLKVMEDGLIVGFITDTNQFIQINPPSEAIDNDNIEILKHAGYKFTDKSNSAELAFTTKGDETDDRMKSVTNINLETQFYSIFRTIVRIQMNQFENRNIRKEIIQAIDDPYFSYRNKLKTIQEKLLKLIDKYIDFKEMKEEELKNVENIVMCNENTCGLEDSPTYCLSTEDGECVTLFPKNHLISGFDNKKLYYERMADELIRYNRTRLFMFYPKTYMNITNIDFNIDDSELFLLESKLNRDYFRDLQSYNSGEYINNITYDTAQPDDYNKSIQHYTNKVALNEQEKILNKEKKTSNDIELQDFIVDCIDHTKPNVIGNLKLGSWRKIFPSNAKELVFKNSITCSYIPIIYIFQQVFQKTISIKNIKTALGKGYSDIFKLQIPNVQERVIFTLKQQGKKNLMQKVKTNSFDEVLFSDEYYISDFDWWVFCTTARLPVIMFSSTSLKPSLPSVNWLKLGNRNIPDDKYYFVRSPPTGDVNYPKKYHVVQNGYSLNDLSDMKFVEAIRGKEEYKQNVQPIAEYLLSKNLITK